MHSKNVRIKQIFFLQKLDIFIFKNTRFLDLFHFRKIFNFQGLGKVGDSAIDRLIELINDLPDSEDEDAEPNKEDEGIVFIL